jgi:hypothetical protein
VIQQEKPLTQKPAQPPAIQPDRKAKPKTQ